MKRKSSFPAWLRGMLGCTCLMVSCVGMAAEDSFTYENAVIRVAGEHCRKEVLQNDVRAYANRNYVYKSVPKELQGTFFTQVFGGEKAKITVEVKEDTTLWLVTESREAEYLPKDWELRHEGAFFYTDMANCRMRAYSREVKKGEKFEIPQVNWTGSQLLFADEPIAWNPPRPAQPRLTRMLYNHPGLVDDLAVGLWVWIVPVDFNEDGKTDFILSCEDTPYNGTYRFVNPGVDANHPGLGVRPKSSAPEPNPAMPVFRPGERISHGSINVQPSWVDGQVRVLRPNQEFPDFTHTGLRRPVDLGLKPNIHPRNVRGNMWKYVDFDGDGVLDLAVGTDDWSPYGWDNAWDENGVWKNDQTHGNVYIIRNRGTNEKPEYETPEMLQDCQGNVILTYGWPSPNFVDMDGDGDLDLFCGEFRDNFTYFENIGTRTEPRYAPGVWVRVEDGSLAEIDLCMATPVIFDWNGDGHPDILCGDEDGRVAYFENTGKFRKENINGITVKCPIFKDLFYFQQEAYELKAGALATPCCADLNGDGAIDILCGTSAGYILYFENLSEPGVEYPKWARPVYLEADGKVAHINAVPNGSIQGPIEEKWGYTTLTVADWDGDGLLDIMWSHIWGKPGWFKNIGTKTEPRFAAEQPVEVEWEGEQPQLAWGWLKPEGKKLLTQWRTTPVMFDWNEDGLMDLCMLDTEGYLAFFERYRDADGTLKLKHPRRIFCDMQGNPLRLNGGKAGGSGRRKICIVDYDMDGKADLLLNSRNAVFYKQMKAEDGKYYFQRMGDIDSRRLAGHSSSPTVADFNQDGIPDVVIGAEDGRLYYMRNPLSDKEQ
ncbi:MAG: VCBS repeat-containing protein [Planctomycetia bacterium]|nr:VCBS repeat-containing protein [Planctomycetia bacterium]